MIAIQDGAGTSPASRPDVATMLTFTPVAAGGVMTAATMNELLVAVNAARSMVGWKAATWSTILAPQDPVPAPGVRILGRHLEVLRKRMNEALQAAGIVAQEFTDANVGNQVVIKAVHVKELQERTK